jgi:hypothetical protein
MTRDIPSLRLATCKAVSWWTDKWTYYLPLGLRPSCFIDLMRLEVVPWNKIFWAPCLVEDVHIKRTYEFVVHVSISRYLCVPIISNTLIIFHPDKCLHPLDIHLHILNRSYRSDVMDKTDRIDDHYICANTTTAVMLLIVEISFGAPCSLHAR